MAKTSSKFINLAMTLTLLAPTGCDLVPDEAADLEAGVESEEDSLRQARPAENIAVPAPLKVDRIGGITSRCTTGETGAMAKLRYRATRGTKTDSVLLTFVAHNGYVSVSHERNGKKLGVHVIDGLTKKEVGTDGFAKAGRERDSAYLFAELASEGIMRRIPEAWTCLGSAVDGRIERNGETYFYSWCNFAYDATDAVFTVATAAVAAACCATGVGCIACTIGGGVLTQAVTKTAEAAEARDCRDEDEEQRRMQQELNEQRERQQMQEELREMQEQIKALQRKIQEEEDKKKAEEEERAQMGT